MLATATAAPAKELNSPDIQQRVRALRRTDNWTNWYYLAREYFFLAVPIVSAILFYQNYEAWGLHWLWNIPVTVLAITIIGGCQHRLTTLAHEASHYMLFRNRKLNELVSEWFCMFPMLSTTHFYRLQHLAHHQFVNDPEKDPDVTQMTASGHRYKFPMSPRKFVWECVIKQALWVPNLIRYIRVRAAFNSTGGGSGPYIPPQKTSKLPILFGLGYVAVLIASLTTWTMLGASGWVLVANSAALWALMTAFYLRMSADKFRKVLVKPDISPRLMTIQRFSYLTLLFTSIAGLTLWTGHWWGLYYFLLWLLPLVTSFSFCMILRQLVQHGNADSSLLRNTRIFLVGRLIRMAVFPMGMDYHLPHHMFPMVPHYRLKELHEVLMEAQSYRDNVVIVDGYFFHREHPPVHPTVLDLMAEAH
jgi:fatty acid desaturase